MKQNVNSIILISKKDSQNSENLISENLISCRRRYQKGTFERNFFREFSDQLFFRNVLRRALLPYDFIKQDSNTEVFEKT